MCTHCKKVSEAVYWEVVLIDLGVLSCFGVVGGIKGVRGAGEDRTVASRKWLCLITVVGSSGGGAVEESNGVVRGKELNGTLCNMGKAIW